MMPKIKVPLKRDIYLDWKKFDDFKRKKKKIGRYIIELFYGTSRGGEIIIWEKSDNKTDYKNLSHIYTLSDNKKWVIANQANFMHWPSALVEYKKLKNTGDVLDLMWRNR